MERHDSKLLCNRNKKKKKKICPQIDRHAKIKPDTENEIIKESEHSFTLNSWFYCRSHGNIKKTIFPAVLNRSGGCDTLWATPTKYLSAFRKRVYLLFTLSPFIIQWGAATEGNSEVAYGEINVYASDV